jgi:cell division protein FtsQ
VQHLIIQKHWIFNLIVLIVIMNNSIEVPADVKLLNSISAFLFIIFGFIIMLGIFTWYILLSSINLSKIVVRGDIMHHSASTFRSAVVPNIKGNFYTISLNNTRLAFESLPWIRTALVKRVFPDQIEVYLQEHKPIAIWGQRNDDKMIDAEGVIFDSSENDGEYEKLPQFMGSDAQSNLILKMYQELNTVLMPLQVKLTKIELSPRGSWMVMLESGAQLELGRGSMEVIRERVTLFAGTVGMATTNLNKNVMALQYADLRHANGYALKINGITTLEQSAPTLTAKK